jgi:hypothetical protein
LDFRSTFYKIWQFNKKQSFDVMKKSNKDGKRQITIALLQF